MTYNIKTLDQTLAASESQVADLRPDCAKQIIWAGEKGVQTEVAIIYLHGFSATLGEIRPVPDMVAKALGANLYYARLDGHGQSGEALANATSAQWDIDTEEAIKIGAILGKKTILIGCSTGCTLATLALMRGAKLAGVAFASPNFGMASVFARLLFHMPAIRSWGHLVAGREQIVKSLGPDHETYWTLRYPTRAVYIMDETVRAVWAGFVGKIKTPALFAFCEGDKVISAKLTHRIMQNWGGDVTHIPLNPGVGDDAYKHVCTGDIMSPSQTKPAADAILKWAQQILK